MFAVFKTVFLKILEKHTPTDLKSIFNNKKIPSEKPWLTNEKKKFGKKRSYFNELKLRQSADSFVSFKYFATL